VSTSFSLDTLRSALDSLGVRHELVGTPGPGPFRFCSLRAPESNGVYFSEGGAVPPGNLTGCVILARQPMPEVGDATIIVEHQQVAFYRLMQALSAPTREEAGRIHPTAIVETGATIHESAVIGPYCVVGRARIGARVVLRSHVVVFDGTEIDEDVVVEPHSTIGATGVAWVWDPDTGARIVQPQTGGVRIGAGCFLGTDITVVRGSVNEYTELGEHCVVAHGTKIGHGCRLGREIHCANNVTIAGNVDVGDRSFLGAGCTLRPRVRLARDTTVGAGAVVVKDSTRPGLVLSGVPAVAMQPKSSRAGVPKSIPAGEP